MEILFEKKRAPGRERAYECGRGDATGAAVVITGRRNVGPVSLAKPNAKNGGFRG
jgi:hypothetical protein